MYRHPYFDLLLHDDDELSILLGSRIMERTTIHEWPLSCVQRLRTAEGSSHIYKVQAEPSVEAKFYTAARSPLLVGSHVLHESNKPAALLLEYVDAPRLSDLSRSETDALRICDTVTEQISQIAGDLPVLTNIGSKTRWDGYCDSLLKDLEMLTDNGTFQMVDHVIIQKLTYFFEEPSLLAAIHSQTGYVHGDLTGNNVLVLPDGRYKVIDWQRPIWGPVVLNKMNLLGSLGLDASR